MKDYFSFSMYKEQMRKLKLPTMILIFMTTFFLIMEVILNVVTESKNDPNWLFPSAWHLALTPLASVILSGILMKDLRKRNGCDFYHALPVSRGAIVVASIEATLCWTFVYMAIPSIIQLCVIYPMGFEMHFDHFLNVMVFGTVTSVYFNGAWWLGHSLTGTRFSHFVVTLTILFGLRGFLAIFGYMLQFIMPYLLLNRFSFFFQPGKYNLFLGYIGSTGITATNVIYTLLLSVIYIGLALFLIPKKPSETAGAPTWSSKMETVIRVILSCAVCIPALFGLITMVFVEEAKGNQLFEGITSVVVLIFFCLAVIIYFLYEIVQTKQFKKSFKHWKGLLWVAAFNVVVFVVITVFHSSVASTKPEPQEIESVTLVKSNSIIDDVEEYSLARYFFGDKKNEKNFQKMIYGIRLTDDAIKRAVSSELDYAIAEGSNYDFWYSILETQDLQRIYEFFDEVSSNDGSDYGAEMSERAKNYNQHATEIFDHRGVQVGVKIKLTNGKTIYRRLNLPRYVFYELLEKEEFISRIENLDFDTMIRGYRPNAKNGTGVDIMIAGNIKIEEDSNDVLDALEKDIRSMPLQQKKDLLFRPIHYTRGPAIKFDEEWTFISLINPYFSSETILMVSPNLTPNVYNFIENNSYVQRYKQYWELQKQKGVDHVSD